MRGTRGARRTATRRRAGREHLSLGPGARRWLGPRGSRLGRGEAMHRIIIANRRGHQVVEWETTDTDEARDQIAAAERILQEAREQGCAVSKKVGGRHVLDDGPF